MRKTALRLSLCGGCATLIAAVLAATHAVSYHFSPLPVGGEVLLGLASTAAVALATRTPRHAAAH